MKVVVYLYFFGVYLATLLKAKGNGHGQQIEGVPAQDFAEYRDEASLDDDEEVVLSEKESKRRLVIIIKRLDVDENGKITKDELKNWMRKVQLREASDDAVELMVAVDENMDGFLDWDEYYNMTYLGLSESDMKEEEDQYGFKYEVLFKRDVRKWKSADVNADDRLSQKELMAFLHPHYFSYMEDIVLLETMEIMDKNDDGFIELQDYLADGYDLDGGDEEPEWVTDQKRFFSELKDKNKDGKLDKEEMRSWLLPKDQDPLDLAATHLILDADSNKDKFLTIEEILDHHDVFAKSQVTDWGDYLKRHDEF